MNRMFHRFKSAFYLTARKVDDKKSIAHESERKWKSQSPARNCCLYMLRKLRRIKEWTNDRETKSGAESEENKSTGEEKEIFFCVNIVCIEFDFIVIIAAVEVTVEVSSMLKLSANHLQKTAQAKIVRNSIDQMKFFNFFCFHALFLSLFWVFFNRNVMQPNEPKRF